MNAKDSQIIQMDTAGLIVIKDNKLLLAYSKNKRAWYLPGGKIQPGETSLQSLEREILEELNLILISDQLKFYGHISAPAYGEKENTVMEQDCYWYHLDTDIQPSNEIEAVDFFSYEKYKTEPAQVLGVLEVFRRLRLDRLID